MRAIVSIFLLAWVATSSALSSTSRNVAVASQIITLDLVIDSAAYIVPFLRRYNELLMTAQTAKKADMSEEVRNLYFARGHILPDLQELHSTMISMSKNAEGVLQDFGMDSEFKSFFTLISTLSGSFEKKFATMSNMVKMTKSDTQLISEMLTQLENLAYEARTIRNKIAESSNLPKRYHSGAEFKENFQSLYLSIGNGFLFTRKMHNLDVILTRWSIQRDLLIQALSKYRGDLAPHAYIAVDPKIFLKQSLTKCLESFIAYQFEFVYLSETLQSILFGAKAITVTDNTSLVETIGSIQSRESQLKELWGDISVFLSKETEILATTEKNLEKIEEILAIGIKIREQLAKTGEIRPRFELSSSGVTADNVAPIPITEIELNKSLQMLHKFNADISSVLDNDAFALTIIAETGSDQPLGKNEGAAYLTKVGSIVDSMASLLPELLQLASTKENKSTIYQIFAAVYRLWFYFALMKPTGSDWSFGLLASKDAPLKTKRDLLSHKQFCVEVGKEINSLIQILLSKEMIREFVILRAKTNAKVEAWEAAPRPMLAEPTSAVWSKSVTIFSNLSEVVSDIRFYMDKSGPFTVLEDITNELSTNNLPFNILSDKPEEVKKVINIIVPVAKVTSP